MRVLILGGTTEGNALARAIAARTDLNAILSLAGRTENPVLPPIATRIGGFGGVDGLARYLADERVSLTVDATHPFAAQISANAVRACARIAVPLARFSRPPWHARPGDAWTSVPDVAAAVSAMGEQPRRVLLTVGRLGLAAFQAAPQHAYVIRTIDPPDPAHVPPKHRLVFDRGPFRLADEEALMRRERVVVLVTKNSGGAAARAKLDAARTLGIEVVLVDRPPSSADVAHFDSVDAVLAWIADHGTTPRP